MLVLFLLTGSSLPQVPDDRRPKSIVDYYFLLPQKYLPYLTADSRRAREAAIQSKDLDGAFLKSGLGNLPLACEQKASYTGSIRPRE